MFDSLFGVLAVVVLFILAARQGSRLKSIERELAVMRNMLLAAATDAEAPLSAGGSAAKNDAGAAAPEATRPANRDAPPDRAETEDAAALAGGGAAVTGPWSRQAAAARPEVPAERAAEPDIETALGTRWAVWVGGLALALGGIFLVRYSIEAGIFGPGVRLTLAALFGLLLAAAGEFLRRTGMRLPVDGLRNAYLPAVLTAAAAFTLFATVYAAHGIYGFLGAPAAFLLLGVIGLATIAAALLHGQGLAGLGLLGSLATPLLVASVAPNVWALFGFLAIVLAATGAIARLRGWTLLMTGGMVGNGLWATAYLAAAPQPLLGPVGLLAATMLAVLVFVWLRGRPATTEGIRATFEGPSTAAALFLAATALAVGHDDATAASGTLFAGLLLAGLVAAALYRPAAVALYHGAGVAILLLILVAIVPEGSIDIDGDPLNVAYGLLDPLTVKLLLGLAPLFLGAGIWQARRLVSTLPLRAASFAAWAGLVPLAVLAMHWLTLGNLDHDPAHAAAGLILALLLAAGAEWVASSESPPRQGGAAVSALLIAAAAAALLAFEIGFGSGLTTILSGLFAIVPALATRRRAYPALGWLSVAAAVVTLLRVAIDPTIVGAANLSTTPVLNALLPGFGLPALAFAFAAWQLARTTGGRPRLALEALAALFCLLTLAMLVRHAMHGGVLDNSTPTLAEQAIYTMIAIGAAAVLVALDRRRPSIVFRIGSLVIGIISAAIIAVQHMVFLNPLFTNESTGAIPVFNLLFLAYLLPAAALAACALYTRGKRPTWFVGMLAVIAAILGFAYVTLSLRRLFHGEFIAFWKGMSPLETYAYSALWLVLGVILLVAGIVLRSRLVRLASAALVIVAVAKVFLIDMSELEGMLRALSFIGLGAALIGIGLFYQRMLGARTPAKPT